MLRYVLIVGNVALAGMLAGCQGLTEQQRVWLDEAERACEQGRYERAIEQSTLFIENAADRPELNRALYVRGLSYAKSQRREAAREDLLRCARSGPDADLRWRAYTVLGVLDYENGRWEAAAHSFATALETAPQASPTEVLLYRRGTCYERTGRWAAARQPYQRIVEEFPVSSVVRAARRRLQINADHFAVQCGVFSSRTNADDLVAELQRDGLRPAIRREPRNGLMMNVVLVGDYSSYEDALDALASIKAYVPGAVLWP